MAAPGDRDYWNHNTAYHPWLVGIAAEHGDRTRSTDSRQFGRSPSVTAISRISNPEHAGSTSSRLSPACITWI